MRRRVTLIVAAVVAVAVLAGVAVWAFPVFTVRDIEVEGNTNVAAEQVVEATGVGEGENLVRVDTTAAAGGVASLPWVRQATVGRHLPGTLKVTVVERTAVLKSGDKLIDDQGEEFSVDNPPEGILEAEGEAAAAPEVAEAAVALDPETRGQMAKVSAASPEEITFHTKDGREVYWGSAEAAHDKALATRTVLKREGQHWNVSNPQLVTVR
ncbi:hypothetical protein CFRA_08070 [Corynebacterium frankenforstense DSM 45800]|uniref:POTRA domain-containing protein n=1 Tax=Corynebacterium frankenforstense DSM 45800 TaxID=1437875 RepID=A0A1L7CTR8_9CORY|nr:hypothetical protein CFRA_08070 [Corynebacterium frankenforstense DSM 45800]